MKQTDEVTFREQLIVWCPSCKSRDITTEESPFRADSLYIVAPLVCKSCGYSFSLNIEIIKEAFSKKEVNR